MLCGDSVCSGGIRLVERDYLIFNEINRWKYITGRHICDMVGFVGKRACDRRLNKLITAGYILRDKKIMYGISANYSLTAKGKALIGVANKKEHIRVEQISHDIAVADTAIFFNRKFGIPYSDMLSEKQLHQRDGFGNRVHRPDFVFIKNNKEYCVEVELSLKSKDRFKKNIISNFNDYYCQVWIVPDLHTAIFKFLKEMSENYPNIKILELKGVKNYET